MRLPRVLWVRLVFSLATPSPCADAISCASDAHRPPLSAIPVSLFTPPPPPDRCLAVSREPSLLGPYTQPVCSSQHLTEVSWAWRWMRPPSSHYAIFFTAEELSCSSFLYSLPPWTDALCLRTVPHLTVTISLPGNRTFLHHSLWDRHLE